LYSGLATVQTCMPSYPGLSAATSISGNGRYRAFASEAVMALHTCCWRGHEFTTLGEEYQALFAPNLPAAYQVSEVRPSWTGKAYAYRYRGGDVTVDLRTTLPGPLFSTTGTVLRIRAASGAEWRSFQDLAGRAPTLGCIDSEPGYRARILLVTSRHLPYVLVASQPIIAIRSISHMYYEFTWARPGARLLIVPLVVAADAPYQPARQKLWLSLAAHPPLEAVETIQEQPGSLRIASHFPGARLAPVPVALALLGRAGGLAIPPTATTLLQTWCGPYQVAAGSRHTTTIQMAWSTARLQATIPVTRVADLAAIPEELAYAGDATWEPGTVMDQLLALRTWAPVLSAAPQALRAQLLPQLAVPTPAQLRAAVEIIREPASGLPWGRWRSMWAHNGDACYDVDWYNGLALSGLARAMESGVEAISAPARTLAQACVRQRAALYDYFTVFNDWSWGTAWTDPRGWMWNADCLHNGLEGILAEARMRSQEGDRAGAAQARALAARHALGLRAAHELPAWIEELKPRLASPRAATYRIDRMVTWSGGGPAPATTSPALGVQGFASFRDLAYCTVETRNPYVLAGMNAEWNALLKAHTAPAWQELLATAYDQQPERYRDWIAFYIGTDWQERRRKGDQEARVQASVFYNLAPEVAFRRFVRGEDPAAIEARYQTPLGLVEQLLLRAGFMLAHDAPVATTAVVAHRPRRAVARAFPHALRRGQRRAAYQR